MYDILTIDEYKDTFEGDSEHQLIDVREIDEYEAGHLPDAVNIPMSEFQARSDEISMDKPLVLVCATGARSGMVAEFMVASGHGDVYNLTDGTKGWMKRGLPVETED
jgi:rhodanese-related sulfurtransferase